MRYAITVEYDGAGYSGWQRQLNAVTVQQTEEEALRVLTGEETVIVGAGRNEAGGYAAGAGAQFHTARELGG